MHAIKRLNWNILSIESSTNSFLAVLTPSLRVHVAKKVDNNHRHMTPGSRMSLRSLGH